jgi:hypothetical protein
LIHETAGYGTVPDVKEAKKGFREKYRIDSVHLTTRTLLNYDDYLLQGLSEAQRKRGFLFLILFLILHGHPFVGRRQVSCMMESSNNLRVIAVYFHFSEERFTKKTGTLMGVPPPPLQLPPNAITPVKGVIQLTNRYYKHLDRVVHLPNRYHNA